jgi:hypothetical protein
MATAMDDPPDSSALTDETTTTTTSTIITTFDPTLLIEYLSDLAVVILDASREDLQVSLLSYPDTLQRCSKFAADPNSLVLYLRKEVGEGTAAQNGDFQISSHFMLLTFFRGWQNSIRVLPQCRILCWSNNNHIRRYNETCSPP